MRWVLRAAFLIFFILPAALAAVVLVVFVEDGPLVPAQPAPSPEDVVATRAFVHQVRAAAQPGAADSLVTVTAEEMNAVLRVGARFLPGLRAVTRVEGGRVHGVASLPLPWPARGRWLNGEAVAPPFEGRLRLDALSVGGVALPPDAMIEAGRIAANLALGDRRGDKMLYSAEAMTVAGGAATFEMALSDESKASVMRGLFGALRGAEMPSGELIDGYYVAIRDALDDGRLPAEGSFLAHIRFALEAAHRAGREGDLANEYTAAIFGLAKACGARDFGLIVGRLAAAPLKAEGDWRRDCNAVTFAGRIDTRRHFITAAAIQAASNRGFAISVGEFKELHDSLSAKGGFDFTDIAANNSGIRLSNRMMAAPAAAWPGLISRLDEEGDLLVGFDDVPGLMSREEFAARFGDVDSEAYARMVAAIEAKIDLLPLHLP